MGQDTKDLGTEACRDFEPFVRAVALASAREGWSPGTVTVDGRAGRYGVSIDEYRRVSRAYGYGDVTAERLLSGPLQDELGEHLLAEHWRRAVRSAVGWTGARAGRIQAVARRAASTWLADREDEAGEGGRSFAHDPAGFLDVVTRSMGLGAAVAPESRAQTEALTLAPWDQ